MSAIISLNEKVNKTPALILSKLSFKQFLSLYPEAEINQNNIDEDHKTQFKLLKTMINQHIKNQFKPVDTDYYYARGKKQGRLFVNKMGLQRLWSKFRGILCDGIYKDVDMINAHPCILYYICSLNNINEYTLKSLKTYINEREEKLRDLMTDDNLTRSEAKLLFIKSINSNIKITKLDKKNIKNQFFLKFDESIKEIQQILTSKNPELKSELLRKKSENVEGRLVNNLLCKIENEILQKVIKYTSEHTDFIVKILMFDGFMGEGEIDLNSLNELTKEYNIKWTFKEHDISILDDLENMNFDDNIQSFVCNDLVEMTDFLLEYVFKNKFSKCNNTVYYLYSYIWISNEKAIKNELIKVISKQDLWTVNKKDYIHVSKIMSKIEDMIKFIISRIEDNPEFVNQIWENTLNKLFFQNGYYCCESSKFKNYNDTENAFFIINRNLDLKSNIEIRNNIYRKVLNPIFGIDDAIKDKDNIQYLQYFLYKVARRMAGYIQDKEWILLEGLRNSGKGLFCDMLKLAFGKYIRTTNSGNFKLKNNESTDNAKANSWILDYQFSRLAITNEISIANQKDKIDGNSIKKFCSGGDCLEGRKNFKDEVEFRVQSGLMICCNDFPEVSPADALETCVNIQMTSKFIDEDYNENNKLNGFKYYLKDDNIKNWIKNDDIINEFILILLEHLNKPCSLPQAIINKRKEESAEDPDDTVRLCDAFLFTNDEEDKISNNQLKEIKSKLSLPFTINKIGKIIIGKGAKRFKSNSSRGFSKIKLKESS